MAGPERTTGAAGVALATLAALGGCALVAPHLERPRLDVVAIHLESASLGEQRFRVRMKVSNPNDRALPVRGIDYTLRVADEDFGAGRSTGAFTVPARGEAEFELEMTTHLATSLWKIAPYLRDGAGPVPYQLAGTVSTDVPFLRSIPFDQRGTYAPR